MSFTDIFIRRPVFATVLSLTILLIGIRSYFSLQVRLYPRIDASVISVRTHYAGADAALMEGFVTTPLENALGGVDGIDYMVSNSFNENSTVIIYFQLGYDINVAMADVNSKVNSIRYLLPREIDDPVIIKSDPNASPSMYLSFSSKTLKREAITDYLNRLVQPQLQSLTGVGQAQVLGPSYAMRIWLDHRLMASKNITPADIDHAIKLQSLQAPGGMLKTSLEEFVVKTFSEASTEQQFNDLVIRHRGGELTKIRDIGKAQLGARFMDLSVWMNGIDGAAISITPLSTANPLDVAKSVKGIFAQLVSSLPRDILGKITWDSSKFIGESIGEVKKTIVEATLCVVLVVLLFLGSLRTLLVPVVTIPLSLAGVCIFMYLLGYSLNTITLLSMVLAIGIVVDDAIVVAENIHRHISLGKSPREASLVGAREIQFAVIAMTFTLAAVYAPIGFLTGLIGSLFKEFAFTLAGAVIVSGFIALTLSPMMCSKIMLPAGTKESAFSSKIHHIFDRINGSYTRLLQKTIAHGGKVLATIPLIFIATGLLYSVIPQELAPREDQGFLLAPMLAPTSTNINYMEKYSKMVDQMLVKIPELESRLVINGYSFNGPAANAGVALLILKPWSERQRSVDQIISDLAPQLWSIPGIISFPTNPSSLPGAGGEDPIAIQLQTLGDYAKLHGTVQEIANAARKNPRLYNVRVEPKLDKTQFGIHINREKAGVLGIKVRDIGSAINLLLGQPTAGHFSIEGRSYDVIPQLFPDISNSPDVMNNLYLRTAAGELVSLSNMVTTDESVIPESIKHFQQLRSFSITAGTVPGYTLGQALDFFKDTIGKIAPAEVKVDYSGQSRLYLQTGNQMLFTFLFAIVFIFLVLAAQFESFRDPLIVLFTIPLSMFGALLVMYLTKTTLNIYSEIGLITLIGLISKHGILMVEFANQLQEEGRSIRDAIITAATTRLRPILMTTAAMVLGAVPLAMATGAGANSRHQIGWVIIGGMMIGTMFTLFLVPTVYSYLATKKTKIS